MSRKRDRPPWGSIDELPSGRFRLRGIYDGERKTVGTFNSRAEAFGVSSEIAKAIAGKPRGLTLATWGAKWLDRRELIGKHRAVHDTRGLWRCYIDSHPIGAKLVREVKPQHVRQWLNDLAGMPSRRGGLLSASRRRNALSAVSASFDAAVVAGHANSNPCTGVPRPRDEARTEDEWTFLKANEVKRLLEHPDLPARQRRIYTIAIATGLRSGELWGLTWPDVRDDYLWVRFGNSRGGPTKGGKPRRVELLPVARKAFAELRSLGGAARIVGHVFVGRGGDPHAKGYDAQWAGSWVGSGKARRWRDGWREKTGTRSGVRFHDLRHTCASHLIMGTWGRAWRLEEVQVMLGHQSRTTTERYAHLAPEGMSRAVREAEEQWRW